MNRPIPSGARLQLGIWADTDGAVMQWHATAWDPATDETFAIIVQAVGPFDDQPSLSAMLAEALAALQERGIQLELFP